jgi:hypothetical protein
MRGKLVVVNMWNTRVVTPMKVSKKNHGNKMIVANVIGTT